MLESRVEAKLRWAVEQAGGLCLKFVSPGNAGVGDRIIVLPGCGIEFVETKRPQGGRLSEVQKYQRERFNALGVRVHLITSYEDVERFEREVIHRCNIDRTYIRR